MEIEDGNGRRLMIKYGPSEKVSRGHSALEYLRTRGFTPPAVATVCEPVNLLMEGSVSIHETAPGLDLLGILSTDEDAASHLGSAAATWIAALHRLSIEGVFGAVQHSEARPAPGLDTRVLRLQNAFRLALEQRQKEDEPNVWCHGDFHCDHVFVDSNRTTAIDLDKFGGGKCALDIGYFLGQTASIGWDRFGSFAATAVLRKAFLTEYQDLTGYAKQERIALHVGSSLLQAVQHRYRKRILRSEFLNAALDAARDCLEGKPLPD